MPIPVRLRLESLEDRRTPATLAPDGRTVTFLDADGDAATVAFNKPVLTAANLGSVFVFDVGLMPGDNTLRQQLQRLDLSGLPAGLSVTAAATAALGGDGKVHVGFVNATGKDVGTIAISGDLGRIVAGDANPKTAGLKGLSVGSLGVAGVLTQAPGGSLASVVAGGLGGLNVVGDMKGASVAVTGGTDGKIGTIRIGGSLSADPATDSTGLIDAAGTIGPVTIGGDVAGGDQPNSGLRAGGTLGPVAIAGDLRGGLGDDSATLVGARGIKGVTIGTTAAARSILGGGGTRSATITAFDGNIGRVTVTGNLTAGIGMGSASIAAGNLTGKGGKIAAVTVFGDMTGVGTDSASIAGAAGIGTVRVGSLTGAGLNSGRISTGGVLTGLTVDRDLTGGPGDGSGFVTAGAAIRTITFGGSLVGGTGRNSGSIQVGNGNLGTVKIGGDLTGGVGDYSGAVQAYGTLLPNNKMFGGRIASVTVTGDVRGGTGKYSAAIYADDRIGRVLIGTPTGTGGLFGAGPFSATVTAAGAGIGSVTIRGDVTGGTGDFSASISTPGKLGPVSVQPNGTSFGDVTGGVGRRSASVHGGTIAKVTVAGSVAGGTGVHSAAITADKAIGLVSVGKNWAGASIAAGVDAGLDGYFGTGDDTRTGAGVITGVTIKGTANGTVGGTDHFAFTAGHVRGVKVNGVAVVLTPGPGNDTTPEALGTTGDFVVVELAP